jgi:hypothetical protein
LKTPDRFVGWLPFAAGNSSPLSGWHAWRPARKSKNLLILSKRFGEIDDGLLPFPTSLE